MGEVPFKNKNETEMITVEGSVFDGNGIALDDVMLETWQCDENGQFLEDTGFARFIPDKLTLISLRIRSTLPTKLDVSSSKSLEKMSH